MSSSFWVYLLFLMFILSTIVKDYICYDRRERVAHGEAFFPSVNCIVVCEVNVV